MMARGGAGPEGPGQPRNARRPAEAGGRRNSTAPADAIPAGRKLRAGRSRKSAGGRFERPKVQQEGGARPGSEASIDSLRKLAAALGVSASTAREYVRRPDWPFPRRGDWSGQIAHIQAWRARTLAPNPAAGPEGPAAGPPVGSGAGGPDLASEPIHELRASPERLAKLQLTITRRAKLELERAILAGQYVKREDEDRRRLAQIHAVKTALLAWVHRLPPMLVGLEAAAMEEVLREEVTKVLNAFAGEPG